METHPIYGMVPEGFLQVHKEDPEKVFYYEIESWCYGLSRFPDQITNKLIHALIREMSGSFLYAIENHFAFDLVRVAKKLNQACEGVVNEKEIALHLIACLPNPATLSEQSFSVFKEIIEKAKNTYPDVVQKFENRVKNIKPS